MRKVINFSVDNYYAFALCDDGTMWKLTLPDECVGEWTEIPPVPQEQNELQQLKAYHENLKTYHEKLVANLEAIVGSDAPLPELVSKLHMDMCRYKCRIAQLEDHIKQYRKHLNISPEAMALREHLR